MAGVDFGAISQKYGTDANWNALRGSGDPLFAGLDPNANWNAYRPQATSPASPASPAPTSGNRAATPKANPNGFNFDWSNIGGNPQYQIPTQKYADYLKALTDSGVSAEEAKATADRVFSSGLGTAIGLANTNAYGGRNKHDNQAYWQQMWNSDPGYTWDRLIGKGAGSADAALFGPWAGGDPGAEVFGGGGSGAPAAGGGAAAAAGNPGGFDDPSSVLFLNEVMNRLNDLHTQQTAKDPFEQLLQLMGLMRVGDLSGAPYTQGEDAALITQYRDPITLARDTAKKQAAQDMARRGISPSSGIFLTEMANIDQAYERSIASASNDLGVRAVDEKQRRADQQLSILNDLLGVSHTSQDRSNAIGREILSTAEIFPNFDEKRFNLLMGAAGEGAASPGSILGNLLSLGQLNLNASNSAFNQTQTNRNNSAQGAYAMGQLINAILNGAAGLF